MGSDLFGYVDYLDDHASAKITKTTPTKRTKNLKISISVADLRNRIQCLLAEEWLSTKKPKLRKEVLNPNEIFAGAAGQKMIKKSEILDEILPLIESKSEKLCAFYQKLLDELLLEFSLEDKLDRIIKGAGRDKFFKLMQQHYYKKTLAKNDNTSSWSQKHGVDWQTIIKSITALEEKDPNTSLGKPGFASAWFNFLATYERENLPNLKFVMKKLIQIYHENIDNPFQPAEMAALDGSIKKYAIFLAIFLHQNQHNTFSQNQFTLFKINEMGGSALIGYVKKNNMSFQDFVNLHMPERYRQIFHQNYRSRRGQSNFTI